MLDNCLRANKYFMYISTKITSIDDLVDHIIIFFNLEPSEKSKLLHNDSLDANYIANQLLHFSKSSTGFSESNIPANHFSQINVTPSYFSSQIHGLPLGMYIIEFLDGDAEHCGPLRKRSSDSSNSTSKNQEIEPNSSINITLSNNSTSSQQYIYQSSSGIVKSIILSASDGSDVNKSIEDVQLVDSYLPLTLSSTGQTWFVGPVSKKETTFTGTDSNGNTHTVTVVGKYIPPIPTTIGNVDLTVESSQFDNTTQISIQSQLKYDGSSTGTFISISGDSTTNFSNLKTTGVSLEITVTDNSVSPPKKAVYIHHVTNKLHASTINMCVPGTEKPIGSVKITQTAYNPCIESNGNNTIVAVNVTENNQTELQNINFITINNVEKRAVIITKNNAVYESQITWVSENQVLILLDDIMIYGSNVKPSADQLKSIIGDGNQLESDNAICISIYNKTIELVEHIAFTDVSITDQFATIDMEQVDGDGVMYTVIATDNANSGSSQLHNSDGTSAVVFEAKQFSSSGVEYEEGTGSSGTKIRVVMDNTNKIVYAKILQKGQGHTTGDYIELTSTNISGYIQLTINKVTASGEIDVENISETIHSHFANVKLDNKDTVLENGYPYDSSDTSYPITGSVCNSN